MANEADILQVNNLEYRQITMADASAVPKGTLIIITDDPNTGDIFRGGVGGPLLAPAGFAAVEKVASDGQTTIPIIVRGDVDAVADGAITIGKLVCTGAGAANRVREVGAASVERLAMIIGRCMETASDGEKVRIRLMLG